MALAHVFFVFSQSDICLSTKRKLHFKGGMFVVNKREKKKKNCAIRQKTKVSVKNMSSEKEGKVSCWPEFKAAGGGRRAVVGGRRRFE